MKGVTTILRLCCIAKILHAYAIQAKNCVSANLNDKSYTFRKRHLDILHYNIEYVISHYVFKQITPASDQFCFIYYILFLVCFIFISSSQMCIIPKELQNFLIYFSSNLMHIRYVLYIHTLYILFVCYKHECYIQLM